LLLAEHLQFVELPTILRFIVSAKEGELTKNAFLIVRWLIAYFWPFWDRKNVEKIY